MSSISDKPGLDYAKCPNFIDLKKVLSKKTITSVDIVQLGTVTNRCRQICGNVKDSCLDVIDAGKEAKSRNCETGAL